MKLTIILLGFLLPLILVSQEGISDNELWLKVGVEKELNDFSIGLEQGLRYDMDYKERKNNFTELTAGVKVSKV